MSELGKERRLIFIQEAIFRILQLKKSLTELNKKWHSENTLSSKCSRMKHAHTATGTGPA